MLGFGASHGLEEAEAAAINRQRLEKEKGLLWIWLWMNLRFERERNENEKVTGHFGIGILVQWMRERWDEMWSLNKWLPTQWMAPTTVTSLVTSSGGTVSECVSACYQRFQSTCIKHWVTEGINVRSKGINVWQIYVRDFLVTII